MGLRPQPRCFDTRVFFSTEGRVHAKTQQALAGLRENKHNGLARWPGGGRQVNDPAWSLRPEPKGDRSQPERAVADKGESLRKEVGLWIDHRQTVVVIVTDEGEEIRRITSNMEGHTRFAGRSSQDRSREDTRDR